jgi:CheY-like chemotaxis protein
MAPRTRHILVISDDKWVDSELRPALSILDKENEVTIVRTRKELESSGRADLILLDLTLSADKPVEILRWLRSESSYRAVPVFALGADAIGEQISQAYALGANSCLLKGKEQSGGFEKIARAISTYASLLSPAGCNCSATGAPQKALNSKLLLEAAK